MRRTIALFGVILIFLLLGSAFNQQPEPQVDTEDVDLAGGGVISISPCALKPEDTSYYSQSITFDEREFIYGTGPEDAFDAYAPVYLPNGATVKKLVVYYYDNDSYFEASLVIVLGRVRHTTGGGDWMAVAGSEPPAASPTRRISKDETIDYALVQNHLYSYYIALYQDAPSSNVKFHGAKIVYE